MVSIRIGITVLVTFLLFHQATCQIAAIAISLPHIVSLLENVTKTLSPSMPQMAALLENQQNAQMVTNDMIENMTTAMVSLQQRNNQEQLLENITGQLSQQNQILTMMTTLMQRQTERIQRQAIAKDCTDILDQGFNEDYGTYTIKPPDKLVSFEVICDLTTEGGGWIVFQKRLNGTEDFNRPWKDYKNGFGDKATEYWLGLEKLQRLTKNGVWQLRVELEDFSGNPSYVQYNDFTIENIAHTYRLGLGEHSGNTGDIMADHGNQSYSTYEMKMRQTCKTLQCQNTKAIIQQHTRTQDCSRFPKVFGLVNFPEIHRIQPSDLSDNFSVVCDLETDGGGWIILQRRYDGSEDFYRPWQDYKYGFGNMTGEFWLGLEKIHQLTSDGVWTLRVDLEDFSGNTAYAEYSDFNIGDESTKYRLSYNDYSGTAGSTDSLAQHNKNQAFSTYDQDNDAYSANCAQSFKGAWWYGSCSHSNLNGLYTGSPETNHKGMAWHNWKNRWEVLKKSEMKIRLA